MVDGGSPEGPRFNPEQAAVNFADIFGKYSTYIEPDKLFRTTTQSEPQNSFSHDQKGLVSRKYYTKTVGRKYIGKDEMFTPVDTIDIQKNGAIVERVLARKREETEKYYTQLLLKASQEKRNNDMRLTLTTEGKEGRLQVMYDTQGKLIRIEFAPNQVSVETIPEDGYNIQKVTVIDQKESFVISEPEEFAALQVQPALFTRNPNTHYQSVRMLGDGFEVTYDEQEQAYKGIHTDHGQMHNSLTIPAQIDTELILYRLLPRELREDPLHADSSLDDWKRVNWYRELGLTWENLDWDSRRGK